MQKKVLVILCALVVLLGVSGAVFANTVAPGPEASVGIDGQPFTLPVLTFFDEELDKDFFFIGDSEGRPISWMFDADPETGNGGSVTLSGIGDPDPALSLTIGATDLGSPSIFTFTVTIPIIFPPGPSTVTASIVGGLTDFSGNGVSITPIGATVATSSADTTNLGVDVGDPMSFAGTGVILSAFVYGPFPPVPGSQPGPSGPFTTLTLELSFLLSGGGDSAALTASILIEPGQPAAIPEPGTLVLLGSGLLGVVMLGRRRLRK